MKKLKFNRTVYSDSSIKMAIHAFSELAAISMKLKADYAILTFWKCKYTEDQTMKEFENYVIGIENSK